MINSCFVLMIMSAVLCVTQLLATGWVVWSRRRERDARTLESKDVSMNPR